MEDSFSWLINELFVPALELVDELSDATNDSEAIEQFGCDKKRYWCRVARAIGHVDPNQLAGQDLLTPAVRGLRSTWESARDAELADQIIIVNTVGDLWKAFSEEKRPGCQSSAVSYRPGANTVMETCPDSTDEAERIALDRARALVTAEGGEKLAAMEKLIARFQLQMGMDKASVINMPLADFVTAALGDSARADLQRIKAKLAGDTKTHCNGGQPARADSMTPKKKRKRSTERGEGRAKLIPALTTHHKYADGSCLNLEPIGNNELAQLANVAKSTASSFFKEYFKGWEKYRAICERGDATTLVAGLKLMNDEFRPYHLLEAEPADDRQDEE